MKTSVIVSIESMMPTFFTHDANPKKFFGDRVFGYGWKGKVTLKDCRFSQFSVIYYPLDGEVFVQLWDRLTFVYATGREALAPLTARILSRVCIRRAFLAWLQADQVLNVEVTSPTLDRTLTVSDWQDYLYRRDSNAITQSWNCWESLSGRTRRL